MPAVSDDLKEKARKLKELADKGVGGEKENANRMLTELLRKHNLRWEDVDDTHLLRVIPIPNMHDGRQLMIECILSLVPDAKIQQNVEKKTLRVKLDDVQYVEVLDKFQFFWYKFKKERDILLLAFFNKHKKYFIRELHPNLNPDGEVDEEMLKKAKMEQVRVAKFDDEDLFSAGGMPNPEHNSHGVLSHSEMARAKKIYELLEDLVYTRATRNISWSKKFRK